MTDDRPRPQYGEYATPEEQRARIQQPDITDALLSGVAPEPEPVVAEAAAQPAPRHASPLNRLVTIILLAMGAANVLISVFSYLDIVPAIEQSMELMGVSGEFTNYAVAQTWGMVAAIVLVTLYILTLSITWRVLKAGRVSWWIPLVGAVVTYAVVSACLAVPLLGDPAFTSYVTSLS